MLSPRLWAWVTANRCLSGPNWTGSGSHRRVFVTCVLASFNGKPQALVFAGARSRLRLAVNRYLANTQINKMAETWRCPSKMSLKAQKLDSPLTARYFATWPFGFTVELEDPAFHTAAQLDKVNSSCSMPAEWPNKAGCLQSHCALDARDSQTYASDTRRED